MSIRGLWFQWDSAIKIQFTVLVLYKADIIIISLNVICSRYENNAHLALNNNHSLTSFDIFLVKMFMLKK